MLCEQQGASGRMSTRMTALESAQNEIKVQLSEHMQTYQSNQQQNNLVLKNLSSMVSIMMERMGTVQSVCDPKSQPTQITNSHMPSSDPPLNSCEVSAGDTPLVPSSQVIGTEDPFHVAPSNEEGVMVVCSNPQVDSDVGASNVPATEAHESLGAGLGEGGSLAGGLDGAAALGEATPGEDDIGKGGGEVCAKGADSGSKEEGGADGGSVRVVVEGGSGGSTTAVDMITPVVHVDIPQPFNAGKKDTPTKRRRKLKHHSPTKVGGSASQEAHAGEQVSIDIERFGTTPPVKLLIFNVHGTLLDCSLLSDPNPNISIRVTTRSSTRRMVFRPWLTEFIDKCFRHFRVAFWGIKSSTNMEEVVASMMRKFNGLGSHKPLFCWSAKDCEEESGHFGVSKWKKPLSKVWGMWQEWNEGNTVIIDHHRAMVDCNPAANIIVPPAFYVEEMTKLADDNKYLRLHLWPLSKA